MSNPVFPGTERHLLRAQLARIQHNTELVPSGLYEKEKDEETGEYKLAEEEPSLKTEDLKSIENWSHMNPLILKSGRCEHYLPPGLDEEKKEELETELNEQDKTEERFRAVNEDNQLPGEVDAWSQKLKGDQQVYGETTYATNIIASTVWPGAYMISKNGLYYNIYLGDGVKKLGPCFNPVEPPMINKDPEQPEDHGSMRYVEAPKGVKPEGEEAEE